MVSEKDIMYVVEIKWDEISADPYKALSPYNQFYFQIFRDSLLNDETLKILYSDGKETEYDLFVKYSQELGFSVSNVWVSKKDYKRLERLEVKYLAKKNKKSQREIKAYYMPMWNLNYSPAEFIRKPRWAEYDHAYIRRVMGS